MNIFNETLEVNQIKYNKKFPKLDCYDKMVITCPIIAILSKISAHNLSLGKSYDLSLILICMYFLYFFICIIYEDKYLYNQNTINPSNPLSKLYPINKQVCLDLINLWEIYNKTQNPNHSVSLDKEKINKINSLFEKLDNQLMFMLTKQDEQTLNLLKPEDIDSYIKLYMLIIAPQEVKHIQSKIQDLHQKFTDNKSFYLLEQLEKTAKEIYEKSLNENYYFDYKEWYNNIEDWLKNINDEKYLDEAAKQNYKQMIKDINK